MIRVLQNEVFHLTMHSSKQNYSVSTQQRRERDGNSRETKGEKIRGMECELRLFFLSSLSDFSQIGSNWVSFLSVLVSVCLGRFGVTKWEIQPSVPNTRLAESIRGSDWAESE